MTYAEQTFNLNKNNYQERFERLKPFVLSKARGDKDLEQVQYIGILRALHNNPDCSDAYLKSRAYWNMLRYISLQNKNYDKYNENDFAEYLNGEYQFSDLEKQALFIIGFKKYFSTLNPIEKKYVSQRMAGKTDKYIASSLDLSQKGLSYIKKRLKKKFMRICV